MTTRNTAPCLTIQRSISGSSCASWRASSSSIIGTPSRIGNARRSARHTSTSDAFWNLSGPLHTGHARISSSLSSTFLAHGIEFVHARDDEIDQRARLVLRELGGDRHEPAALVREGRAFYGILLGHED